MPKEDWATENGEIIVAPLMGYELLSAFATTIALRLEYASTREAFEREVFEAAQLALTTDQARRLGQSLCDAADQVDAMTPPGGRQ